MADNVELNLTSGGNIISADQISTLNGAPISTGEKMQRMKMDFGEDGTATDVSTTNPLPISITASTGVWGYNSGISGTLTLTGGKKVLRITAIALEAQGSFTINGGDAIIIPYGATDKVSSSIEFEPMGNLINPVIVFTTTKAYLVEYVT